MDDAAVTATASASAAAAARSKWEEAGGDGWFSEAALAERVKALPPPQAAAATAAFARTTTPLQNEEGEEGVFAGLVEKEEEKEEKARYGTGGGVGSGAGGGRWPLCAVDCVEEALEQVTY